jgi:TonB family protein
MFNRFNRVSLTRIVIAWLALLPALAPSTGLHSQGVRTRKISESGLRRLANRVVLPEFPRDAIRARKTGVAVAVLDIDERGAVIKIETLEAPSPSIGAALSRALLQWSFTPPVSEGVPMKMHGKLTFYFLFQHGKPVVLSPDEAPFVGCQGSFCR